LKNILIVDDTPENIDILRNILRDQYKIYASTNGYHALEIVSDKEIDLILLDIQMPDMDGFEVCQLLKNDPLAMDIPVIFATAHSDDESIEAAYEIGGADFLTKPFRPKEVRARVKAYLSLSEKQKNLQRSNNESQLLASQYKHMVDKKLLVSRTDIRGSITYINDKFCTTTGYTEHELMGSPHSIIRHPETSTETFKNMWDTIQNKEAWYGEMKNLKKDGGFYITDTTIIPILDSDSEILEYMSISYDITEIHNLNREIEDTQKEVVFTMGSIGESRSKETGNHVKRVAEYSYLLAKYYGLSETEADLLKQASPMHDIGKVAIPDSVLNKPARFNEKERAVMDTHAQLGYDMLKHSNRPMLKAAATVAYEHHEKWNGTGYPNKLKGEDIHIYGRITALADVFDALGSERVYKKAWNDEKIFELFKEERGQHFDPSLIDIFFDNLDEFLEIRNRLKDSF